MQLKALAFESGDTIPVRFTCDGDDVSPALAWTAPPDGTVSLALVADDPDAPRGTWVHWVVYDLPATLRELPEGFGAGDRLPAGAHLGRNDFRKVGYGGPCPPPGAPHRYYFRLYALDAMLELRPSATRAQLDRAMSGHILGEAEVMGRYGRAL
jgi:Raf kinase inhibitor-like YbhB/YbcL family protein